MSDTNKSKDSAIEWYISNRPTYKKLSLKVENILTEIFEFQQLSYHMIASRVKDIESYKLKVDNPKYDDPISQITDLAGIRVITYVEDEIDKVCKVIETTFDIDATNSLDKSKELGVDRVGYKSVHYIAKLKEDRLNLPEYNIFRDRHFEIQVRTILQHAWAEIEHDRNYKFTGKLPDEISRRFKLLAGVLEISDREFNNISKEIDSISKLIEKGTKEGVLDFELNSTSLKQFIETRFRLLKEQNFFIKFTDDKKVIEELNAFGITTLDDLNKLIPENYIEVVIDSEKEGDKIINSVGLIRALMLIADSEKYFRIAKKSDWSRWSVANHFEKLFKYYNVDWQIIKQEHGITFN